MSVADYFIPVSLSPASLLSLYHVPCHVTTAFQTGFGALGLSARKIVLFYYLHLHFPEAVIFPNFLVHRGVRPISTGWPHVTLLVFAAETLTYLSLWVIVTEEYLAASSSWSTTRVN